MRRILALTLELNNAKSNLSITEPRKRNRSPKSSPKIHSISSTSEDDEDKGTVTLDPKSRKKRRYSDKSGKVRPEKVDKDEAKLNENEDKLKQPEDKANTAEDKAEATKTMSETKPPTPQPPSTEEMEQDGVDQTKTIPEDKKDEDKSKTTKAKVKVAGVLRIWLTHHSKTKYGRPVYEKMNDELLEQLMVGEVAGNYPEGISTFIMNFFTGKTLPGNAGWGEGYGLYGLETLDNVEMIKEAVLRLRVYMDGEDEPLYFRAYLDREETPAGWRAMIARLPNQMYANKNLFPEGVKDYLKKAFAKMTQFSEEDWKVEEVREELTPPTVRVSGTAKFTDTITSLPGKTVSAPGGPLAFRWVAWNKPKKVKTEVKEECNTKHETKPKQETNQQTHNNDNKKKNKNKNKNRVRGGRGSGRGHAQPAAPVQQAPPPPLRTQPCSSSPPFFRVLAPNKASNPAVPTMTKVKPEVKAEEADAEDVDELEAEAVEVEAVKAEVEVPNNNPILD